jgi:UDP-2-acetamido-2,6-beta-L-arabino-hexul-4-ose reductase
LKALITGARGFIGRNLSVALGRAGVDAAGVDLDATRDGWLAGASGAAVVFHLAGVNRPERDEDFGAGNVGSLETLFGVLDETASAAGGAARPAVVLASSTQAAEDNPYGRSKLAAERALEAYAARTGTPGVIYRLPGVFGKWCRPDYNSVVATFCHRVARGLPITISDPLKIVTLVHVDDVVAEFMTHLQGDAAGLTRRTVAPGFSVSLGDLAGRICAFGNARKTLRVEDTSDPFTRRLLGTYASYLPPDDLAYALEQRNDARGTLAEFLKSPHFGQIFVSRTNPGFTRGNHYHDVKIEKFCVLDGDAIIRFRPVLGDEVTEYRVSGREFKVVDIPPGMTHSIENAGTTDLIVLFWASEILDPQRPDAHYVEVSRG